MSPTRFDSHPHRYEISGPSTSRRARLAAMLLAVALMAPTTAGVDLQRSTKPAGAASSDPLVVITGRGWGHGRGMGQFGALGYARDFGWTSAQILDHYYGGTTAGMVPAGGPVDPDRVRVDLVHMRGRATAVALAFGTLHLMDEGGAPLVDLSGAVRITPVGDSMEVATAPGCDGPWTAQAPIARPLVRIVAQSTGTERDGLLEVCGSARSTWYGGEIWATTAPGGGSARTINLVSVEEYLRGVVPNEVPASWPDAALQAQAVAARSYVMAGDTRWAGYADTCDTTLCQVYDGRYTTRRGFRRATDPRTDAAIAATAGQVRRRGDAVARTEFSSSTGGWTAGGDFPAVVDEGDAVLANPNATWRTIVDLTSVEQTYRLGSVVGLAVVERNGLGPDGGRVERVEFRFTRGSVFVDGNRARQMLGLKSNWFSIGNLSRGGVIQEPIDRQLIDRYVDRTYRELVGRPPTEAELAAARGVVQDGSRYRLARQLVRDEHFAGRLVDDLYVRALGRAAEPEGRSYWIDTMAGGLTYVHLGTLFYGSQEYVNRSGGTNTAFVDALYTNILGRSADAGGRRYWVDLLDRGRARPEDVAYAFYISVESRRDRGRDMHRVIHGVEPGASLTERLAERLLAVDDLTLAAELAVDLDLGDP